MSIAHFKCAICKVEEVVLQPHEFDTWRWKFPVCIACMSSTDAMQFFISKRIRFQVTIGSLLGRGVRYMTDYEKIGPDLATNVLCFYTDKTSHKFQMGKISPHQVGNMEKITVNRIGRGYTHVSYVDYIDVEDVHCLLLPIQSA
jgi:hypothetical protein